MASITERRWEATVAGVLMLAAAGSGCDEPVKGAKPGSSALPAVTAVTSPSEDAKAIAQNRCAMCHGAAGKGDGPQAGTLGVKPRDLSAKDWQKSVSDAQIRTAILKGGGAVGKSVLMPANPDLEDKPQVVDALVKLVRGYTQ